MAKRRRFWAASIKEVDPDFSGYEIRYTIIDGDYWEEVSLDDSFFWRTDPQLHERNFDEFWAKCGDPIVTNEGIRRIRAAIPQGEVLENPHYEFAAYSIKDGQHVDRNKFGFAEPVFSSDSYSLGRIIRGTRRTSESEE